MITLLKESMKETVPRNFAEAC